MTNPPPVTHIHIENYFQNNQAAPQPTNNALLVTARALTQPQLFGDERDQIMAKFNQVLAGWGTGKAFYNINGNGDKLELTPSNHFCRFKTVGYACLPTTKDKGEYCISGDFEITSYF